MKSLTQQMLLQARVLVGFLGERAQFSWWPTSFFDPVSKPFLDPVFSKTSRMAQYYGVLEAARREHDERLHVGNYHLFRLPEEVEYDLHLLVQNSRSESLFLDEIKSKESALVSLGGLAGSPVPPTSGPTSVGKISELDSPKIIRIIAGFYQSAFQKADKTYPYLSA
jgi:hypothetical protein